MNRSRRDILSASAGVALAGSSFAAFAGPQEEQGHAHHGEGAKAAGVSPAQEKLVRALNHCVAVSEACLQHCFDVFATGDVSLAHCAETVRDAIALCEATRTLANGRSPHLKAISTVCAAACESCRAECERHAGHHPICGDCARSCVDVIEALKAI